MNRADLKQRAKAQLGGSIFGSVWLYAVLVFFINALIQRLGRVVGLLLTGPLSYGIAKMLLKQSRDGQAMNVAEMFDGFKDDFGGNFLLHLLMSIFIALWSLLLVVPGIIKALGWSMAYYIKVEHPEYTWKQCLDASTALTNGHKGDLFVLHLSFIGWYLIVFVIVGVYEGVILTLLPDSFLGIMLGSLILTVLTGVVDIYLTPYFALSECGFYLRATAPEEPPRQDRSSYTPEF